MKVGTYSINTQNVNQQNTTGLASTNNIQIHSSTGNTGLPQSLAALSQGQLFEGTITRDESGKIMIHLANGESVSARMEGTVSLLENTATFFQVKSNQGGQLALKAVTQSASANPTLIHALEQAGVAIDEANLRLVQEMMKQQLPIDAKSLGNMVKMAYTNKGIDPSLLVQLTKLGLPVTKENIQQFQQYSAGQGSVVENLNTIMQKLPGELTFFQEAGLDGAEVLSRLEEVFFEEDGTNVKSMQMIGTSANISSQEGTYSGKGVQSMTNMQSGEGMQGVTDMQSGEGAQDITRMQSGVGMQGVTSVQSGEEVQGMTSMQSGEGMQGVIENPQSMTGILTDGTETAESFDALLQKLQQGDLKHSSENYKELFLQLSNQIKSMDLSAEQYRVLFQNKGFHKLLAGVMEQEWLLEPKQVNGEKIQEVYERLQNQMSKLEGLLQTLGRAEQNLALTQGTRDVQGNIQFMNDLNQFFNYVQIPLKMANENAKGDLYVYADKRALRKGKDELTAHLHLEMEHLGATDVYVQLKEKKLATNFIMEKEESLDLVMANIDVLTKRLEQKGFMVSTKVELNSEGTKAPDFMQEILNKELPSMAITRYSLDVIV